METHCLKEQQTDLVQMIEAHSQWDEEAKHFMRSLYGQIEELSAENKRLRKALLAQQSKAPRMSSKLRDALYE